MQAFGQPTGDCIRNRFVLISQIVVTLAGEDSGPSREVLISLAVHGKVAPSIAGPGGDAQRDAPRVGSPDAEVAELALNRNARSAEHRCALQPFAGTGCPHVS